MLQPPRRFLTEEEMKAIPAEERAAVIAEWSSFNARLRLEAQRLEAARGGYRGTRGRGGRGRGGRGYHPYAPPQRFSHRSVTFNTPNTPPSPGAKAVPPSPTIQDAQEPVTKGDQEEVKKSTRPCAAFTATGVCKKGLRCPDVHDPEKTAICKRFLYKDDCVYGDTCSLSHIPSPHRSPTCTHFLEKRCTKEHCRYAHINVNPAAPLCEAFARRGYCEKGSACAERHAFECPDFSNTGSCDVKRCPFPHIAHAGRLRKAAGSHTPSEAESSDSGQEAREDNEGAKDRVNIYSSGDNYDSIKGASTGLSQQADFVPFGP